LYLGGFFGYLTPSVSGDLHFSSSINKGRVRTELNGGDPHIGGFFGGCSFRGQELLYITNNTNNGSMDNVFSDSGYGYISGFFGTLDCGMRQVAFSINTNNGLINTTGTCSELYSGGMAGRCDLSYISGDCETVKFSNNTNNGKTTLNLKQKSGSQSLYTGGLFGYFYSNSRPVVFENNNNNAPVFGLVEKKQIYIGGVLGCIDGSKVTLGRSTNYAFVHASVVDVSNDESSECYVSGVVGCFRNYDGTIIIQDNDNFGNVISNSTLHTALTCGLVCKSKNAGLSAITVMNCLNAGDIQGYMAYGVSDRVTNASSVVNIGNVTGTNESYSFWKTLTGSQEFVFGLNDSCQNCDENITLMAWDRDKKNYYTIDGNDSVEDILNRKVDDLGYSMRWNFTSWKKVKIHVGYPVNQDCEVQVGSTLDQCEFLDPDTVFKYHLFHEYSTPPYNEYLRTTVIEDEEEELVLVPWYMIKVTGEVSGEVKGNHYIEASSKQTLLGVVSNLDTYLQSTDSVVGNSDINTLIKEDQSVDGDMNVIVMEKHIVLVDVEENKVPRISVTEVSTAQAVSQLIEVNKSSVLVDINSNNQGFVMRVDVMLPTADLCDSLVGVLRQKCIVNP